MKLIVELSENDYKALKEDGVQNHLTLVDTIIACGVPYEERPQGDLISRSYLKQMIPAPIEDEYKYVHQIIDNAPAVPLPDFKEGYRQAIIDGKANYSRPQGEWISNNYGEHHCSLCHHEADYNEYDYEYYEHLSDYCPNCGAKMMKGGSE